MGATRRRRRPPNFPPTVSWREFRHRGYSCCLASSAGGDRGRPEPGHTASRSRWSSAGTHSPEEALPTRGGRLREPLPHGAPGPLARHLETRLSRSLLSVSELSRPREGLAGETTAQPP